MRTTAHGSMVSVAALATLIPKVTTCGLSAAFQVSFAVIVSLCVIPAPVTGAHLFVTGGLPESTPVGGVTGGNFSGGTFVGGVVDDVGGLSLEVQFASATKETQQPKARAKEAGVIAPLQRFHGRLAREKSRDL